VNATGDIEHIVNILIEEQALVKIPVRLWISSAQGSEFPVDESIDAIDVGSNLMLTMGSLEEMRTKRRYLYQQDRPRDAYTEGLDIGYRQCIITTIDNIYCTITMKKKNKLHLKLSNYISVYNLKKILTPKHSRIV
jgi:hypothetical protein